MRHVLIAAAATFALAIIATAAVNGSAKAGGLGHGFRVNGASAQSNAAPSPDAATPRFTSEARSGLPR